MSVFIYIYIHICEYIYANTYGHACCRRSVEPRYGGPGEKARGEVRGEPMSGTHAWALGMIAQGLHVCKYCLLWGPMYINRAYFGLFGAPG